MYLPTTKTGMDAAIGQYIHGVVAANIAREEAAAVARAAEPGYVEAPFVWDKKYTAKKRTDAEAFTDFVAGVRARQASQGAR